MKVLLLGEFSSFHKYLKDGLQTLGCDVTLAADGDGWKQIPGADISLSGAKSKGRIIRGIEKYIHSLLIARNFQGYDVVQFMAARLYPALINQFITNRIINSNCCISLSAAGGGYACLSAYLANSFEYYAYDYDPSTVKFYDKKTIIGRIRIKNDLNLERKADIIIPISYEYTLGHSGNIQKVIPAPINTDEITYTENHLNGKVIFFHGLNREAAKGTPFIREALNRLSRDFPNEVEVIIDGHMPFNRYVKILSKANVVVDQCCGYGYGINACIAMAQGKVVMAPCRKETMNAIGVSATPLFHVQPDVEQIYNQMKYIVDHKNQIPEWGKKSREYVETFHNYKKVAQQYIDLWRSTGKFS